MAGWDKFFDDFTGVETYGNVNDESTAWAIGFNIEKGNDYIVRVESVAKDLNMKKPQAWQGDKSIVVSEE